MYRLTLVTASVALELQVTDAVRELTDVDWPQFEPYCNEHTDRLQMHISAVREAFKNSHFLLDLLLGR